MFIVEDNDKNLELYRAVLSTIPNLNIQTSSTGKNGFHLIKNSDIDIIILDIRLPDISGIDMCKELRKLDRFKNTPILAVSSFAMKGDKERILKAGFNEYLSKPIMINEFREIIIRYLE